MAAASIGQVHLGELKSAELAQCSSLDDALLLLSSQAGHGAGAGDDLTSHQHSQSGGGVADDGEILIGGQTSPRNSSTAGLDSNSGSSGGWLPSWLPAWFGGPAEEQQGSSSSSSSSSSSKEHGERKDGVSSSTVRSSAPTSLSSPSPSPLSSEHAYPTSSASVPTTPSVPVPVAIKV